jgi:hypothetical protein
MTPDLEFAEHITRRHFLGRFGASIGAVALSSMLSRDGYASIGGHNGPHFAPRARRIIYLHMAGSPSQQDMFDYKPELNNWNGKLCPEEFLENERFAFIKGHPKLLASPHSFSQHGESGAWMVDLLARSQTICASCVRCSPTNSIMRLRN